VDLARERRIAGKVAELRDLLDTGAVDAARTRAMLAGDLETPVADDVSTTFRLPAAWIARADALTAQLPPPAGGKLTRSNVLRAALERGLDDLEEAVARSNDVQEHYTPMELAIMAVDALPRTPDNADALDALRDQIEALSPMPPPLDVIAADVAERGGKQRSAPGPATSTATPPDLSGVLAELDALRARVEALTVPAPPPKRASLDPCNVIRPAAEHPGYCRCGHALAAHVAVYGAGGELVQLRAPGDDR
jgi:hypothetical protein